MDTSNIYIYICIYMLRFLICWRRERERGTDSIAEKRRGRGGPKETDEREPMPANGLD